MPMTNARLVQSLNAKIRAEAKRRRTTADNIRHQFAFALFFKQLFQGDNSNWLVLGGNALLIRTQGGRYTQDIDLARQNNWLSVDEIEQELKTLFSINSPNPNDPTVRFTLLSIQEGSNHGAYGYGSKTLSVKVQMTIADLEFHIFSVDICIQRHINSPVDRVALKPVMDHELLADLPLIPLIPIENHLADKLCAMYELHGITRTASTRYRDLADIVRIIQMCTFSAQKLIGVLEHESQRRKISLPQRIQAPSPEWSSAFPRQCNEYSDFPPHLQTLNAALHFVGESLNCILDSTRNNGIWIPEEQRWIEESTPSAHSTTASLDEATPTK